MERIKRTRRKYLKRERIREIKEVKRVLVIQGEHPHVSPVVGRWFRSKGFKVYTSYLQKGWCVVTFWD